MNTYMLGDVVYERSTYGNDRPVIGYYVHPITGTLEGKERERYRYRRPKEVVIPVPDAPGWDYRKIDGLWFRIKYSIVDGWAKTEKKSANKKEIAWIKAQLQVK